MLRFPPKQGGQLIPHMLFREFCFQAKGILMAEKRNRTLLFLLLLILGSYIFNPVLAESSGEDRLVVFEVFRNYTDVDDLDDKPSATFQSGDAIEALREEFAGQDVIFLEYDWNDAYSPATIRGSRIAHAINLSDDSYDAPFAMVDSGQQIIGGDPDEVNFETDYRSMILASQARAPKADIYAVGTRTEEGKLVFDIDFTNRSGMTLSGASLAYIQAIVYEVVLDEDDDEDEDEQLLDGEVYDQCTEKVVHSYGYVRIVSEIADGDSDTFRIEMNEPTSVQDWANVRALILVDYCNNSQSVPYDMLQAVDVALTEHVYFAQFGSGGGLTSNLVLTNPSDEYTVEGVIEFRDTDGEALDVNVVSALSDKRGALDVAYSELGAVPAFSLEPYETMVIATEDSGEVQVGSVDVNIKSGESTIGGVLKFEYPGIGTAGVGASTRLTGFVVPIQSIDTGIAIHNTGFEPLTVKMTLYENGEVVNLGLDEKGKPRNPKFFYEFGSRAHMSMYVDEYFPTLNRQEFLGTLKVEVFGGQVVATALEMGQEAGQFLSVPVIPLPE